MPPVAAVSFLSAATAPRAPDPVGGGDRGGDGFQAALAATAITTPVVTTPVVATPVTPPALPPTAAMACADPCCARPGTDSGQTDGAATVPADGLAARPVASGALPPPVANAGSRPPKTPPPTNATPSLPPRPDAVAEPRGPAAGPLVAVPPRPATTSTAPPPDDVSPDDPSRDDPASMPAAVAAPSVPFAPMASPALPAAVIATGNRAAPTPSSAPPRTAGGNGIGPSPGGGVARTVDQPGEASFPALALPAASTPTVTGAAAASLHAQSPDEARHRVDAPAPDPALPPAASLVQPAAIAARTPLAGHRAVDPGSARAATIGRDVALAITRHVERGGGSTVTIRLDPVELGRIEVRLQIDPAGKLLASIAADQPAALDLLRRDTAILAQTLSQAGVQAEAGSFSFDTRTGDGGRGWANPTPVRSPVDSADESPAATPAAPAPAVTVRASGRINLVA